MMTVNVIMLSGLARVHLHEDSPDHLSPHQPTSSRVASKLASLPSTETLSPPGILLKIQDIKIPKGSVFQM